MGLCLLCARPGCRVVKGENGGGDGEVEWIKEEDIFGGELELEFANVEGSKGEVVIKFVMEDVLEVGEGEGGGGGVMGMGLCEDCLETGVKKAWELYWGIRRMQRELMEVKEEIKEAMRERVERLKRKRKRDGGRGGGNKEVKVLEKIAKMTLEQKKGPDDSSRTFGRRRAFQEPEEPVDKDPLEEEEDGGASVSNFADLDAGVSSPPDVPDEDDGGDQNFEPDFEDLSSGESEEEREEEDDDSDGEYVPRKRKSKGRRKTSKFLDSEPSDSSRKRRRKHRSCSRKCPRCFSFIRGDPERYQAHMDLHAENDAKGELAINCAQCTFPCRTEKELDWHVHNRHVLPSRVLIRKCNLCLFQTKIWKILKRHVEEEHPNATPEELGPDVMLKCTVCNLQLKTTRAYKNHIRACQKHALPVAGSSEGPSINQCPHCGILFDSADKLQFHVIGTHKRESNYCCETCGKGFVRRENLARHRNTHNPEKRDFVCHLCGMDYAYQFTLNEHYKRFHPDGQMVPGDQNNEELHKCRYCDLTSPFIVVIKRHLKTHKEESGHRCELCGKCYVNANGLRRHLQINHPEKEEMWKCEYCFREYGSQIALQQHIKLHCAIKKLQDQKLDTAHGVRQSV